MSGQQKKQGGRNAISLLFRIICSQCWWNKSCVSCLTFSPPQVHWFPRLWSPLPSPQQRLFFFSERLAAMQNKSFTMGAGFGKVCFPPYHYLNISPLARVDLDKAHQLQTLVVWFTISTHLTLLFDSDRRWFRWTTIWSWGI